METGEFGFEDIFNLGLSPEESNQLRIPFFESGLIMWIIFLVMIPILLNNMLVSTHRAYFLQVTSPFSETIEYSVAKENIH